MSQAAGRVPSFEMTTPSTSAHRPSVFTPPQRQNAGPSTAIISNDFVTRAPADTAAQYATWDKGTSGTVEFYGVPDGSTRPPDETIHDEGSESRGTTPESGCFALSGQMTTPRSRPPVPQHRLCPNTGLAIGPAFSQREVIYSEAVEDRASTPASGQHMVPNQMAMPQTMAFTSQHAQPAALQQAYPVIRLQNGRGPAIPLRQHSALSRPQTPPQLWNTPGVNVPMIPYLQPPYGPSTRGLAPILQLAARHLLPLPPPITNSSYEATQAARFPHLDPRLFTRPRKPEVSLKDPVPIQLQSRSVAAVPKDRCTVQKPGLVCLKIPSATLAQHTQLQDKPSIASAGTDAEIMVREAASVAPILSEEERAKLDTLKTAILTKEAEWRATNTQGYAELSDPLEHALQDLEVNAMAISKLDYLRWRESTWNNGT
jgi:hypothetical protein